jgi:uncharacterized membrane protein YeiH
MSPTTTAALGFLDYIGIGVFALSGALEAARKRQDFVTFVFFAVVTGVGGGTVRDLLIGAPVFWVHGNWTLLICVAAAILVWTTPAKVWGRLGLVWADALGIAIYATYGAAKGIAYGVAPVPAIGMGVLTACLGGIVRDMLAGEPSILLRQEYYVTAAALSAELMVMLMAAGVDKFVAAAIAGGSGFALRSAAIVNHWSLPTYRR